MRATLDAGKKLFQADGPRPFFYDFRKLLPAFFEGLRRATGIFFLPPPLLLRLPLFTSKLCLYFFLFYFVE